MGQSIPDRGTYLWREGRKKLGRVQNTEKKTYGGEAQKQSRSYGIRTGSDPAFTAKILDNQPFSAMRNCWNLFHEALFCSPGYTVGFLSPELQLHKIFIFLMAPPHSTLFYGLWKHPFTHLPLLSSSTTCCLKLFNRCYLTGLAIHSLMTKDYKLSDY